jgi:hypothetical protein
MLAQQMFFLSVVEGGFGFEPLNIFFTGACNRELLQEEEVGVSIFFFPVVTIKEHEYFSSTMFFEVSICNTTFVFTMISYSIFFNLYSHSTHSNGGE